MQIGMVGLGRMGMNMARRLLKGGHRVVAYNRTPDRVREITKEGAKGASSMEELVRELTPPRIVWLMIPAGRPVDEDINILKGLLSKGDIIVDGGNSFYKDDFRHEQELRPQAGIWRSCRFKGKASPRPFFREGPPNETRRGEKPIVKRTMERGRPDEWKARPKELPGCLQDVGGL